MSTFSAIYRNLLWITPPIFCISIALLVFSIMGVVKATRKARLFSVPLVEEQEVEFTEAGRVILCGEGPLMTSRFRHLTYELSAGDVPPMKGQCILFRQTTSGFSTVRLSLRKFNIPKPGRYILSVQGLEAPRPEDTEHQLAFVRPHLSEALAYVLGITLSAGLVITSFVFFLIRLAGVK